MARLISGVVLLLLVKFRVFAIACTTVESSFETYGVVPDVIPNAPAALANVRFPSGVEVKEGNELTPTQVKDTPTVTWDASPNTFYTVAMVDPDVPSREDPKNGELQHWLVGNVPGDNICAGETIAEYVGSGPLQGTGLHRYVFLVYKQSAKICFDEPRLNNTSIENRTNFSVNQFAIKYNFGNPVAGNFYLAQYDDYVPILNKQLGN